MLWILRCGLFCIVAGRGIKRLLDMQRTLSIKNYLNKFVRQMKTHPTIVIATFYMAHHFYYSTQFFMSCWLFRRGRNRKNTNENPCVTLGEISIRFLVTFMGDVIIDYRASTENLLLYISLTRWYRFRINLDQSSY